MINKASDFWASRYEKFGHTGWGNSLFYIYDQFERLALISEEISLLKIAPITALDFGCGTGDFSKLLLKKGIKVWGYDPNVEPNINHPNFKYIKTYSDLNSVDVQMDIVLSVTVLDHILDNTKFQQELTNLHRFVSDQGHLIMLEYALDTPSTSISKYQAFRTIGEWQKRLIASGWKIMSIKPAPHPVMAPSCGFTHYNSRIPVYLLGKATKFAPTNPWLLAMLKKYVTESFNKYGLGHVKNSPLKLICCYPAQNKSTHL